MTKGDFQLSGWGHSLVRELQPADITIEKVAYSAFYQTRLDFAINRAGIKCMMVCGIVTNVGVASTVRDAHIRDIQTITLEDGFAAFCKETHDVSIGSLATVGEVMSIANAINLFEGR